MREGDRRWSGASARSWAAAVWEAISSSLAAASRWKDYRCNHKSKATTLAADEFIRRFLLHVLLTGFRRIRHFGFLANACRNAKLARLRTALDVPAPPPPAKPSDYRERCALLTGRPIDQCPRCGGRMVDLGRPLPRCRRPSDPFPRCDTS